MTRAEGRGSPHVRVVPALSVCFPLLPSAVAPVSFPRPPVRNEVVQLPEQQTLNSE